MKKKWKNLRDKYGKILRNLPVSRSGDPGDEDNGTSWPFFKCMQFLKNQMKPRKTSGNLPKPQPKPLNDDNDDNDDHYGEIEMLDETAAEVMDSQPGWFEVPDAPSTAGTSSTENVAPPSFKRRKITKHTQSTRLLEIEQKKLELLEKKAAHIPQRDEDESFFHSLLPHVKKLDPAKKFVLRM